MDEEFLVPGEGWVDHAPADEETLTPGEGWFDGDGTPTPPGPTTRRRIVIVACG